MSNFLFAIEGINNNTKNVQGWHQRAERWASRHGWRSENFNYHVGALDRWIWQNGLIKTATQCLTESVTPADRIVVMAHSNGCAIAAGMLDADERLAFDELHLIGAAC